MDNILKRINKMAENEGLGLTSLESKIGASKGVLSRAFAKNTDIQAKWISKIVENYPRYNSEWLLTGKEPMIKGQAIKRVDNIIGIPLVSQEVAAGFGNENFSIKEEDIQACYVVPDFNGIDFMIRVKGSSMYPKYSSGDVIACRILKERNFIQWNKTYVVATKEQGMICKRLLPSKKKDNIQVVSDNKDYPPFDIPEKEITGIALIVGVIRLE